MMYLLLKFITEKRKTFSKKLNIVLPKAAYTHRLVLMYVSTCSISIKVAATRYCGTEQFPLSHKGWSGVADAKEEN